MKIAVCDDKISPDILFLDIQMQGINGMEAARRLRLAGKSRADAF